MIIMGHRGAAGLAPENTLDSFDQALQHKVAYVEFDVRRTKDNKLVVIHDSHTKRVAFIKRHIREMTLDEIKHLATRDGRPIPTLQEVLAHIKRRVKINIEIKSAGAAPFVMEEVRRLLKQGYTYEDILLSSFLVSELKALRQIDKEVRLALLHRRSPFGFLLVYRKLNLYGVGFHHLITWPAAIRLAKQRGLFTYSFTVNNLRSAQVFESWGVDGICTDYPDEFAQSIQKRRKVRV